MNSNLTPQEQGYVNRIMDILRSSRVKPNYREDAKTQLIEHIYEARFQGHNFQEELGSPEDFALHFMDSDQVREENLVTQTNNTGKALSYNKRKLPIKGSFLFIFFSGIYFLGMQLLFYLIFTPALSPMNHGYEFSFFRISDYLWWNILLIVINIASSLVLAGITLFFLNKYYKIN